MLLKGCYEDDDDDVMGACNTRGGDEKGVKFWFGNAGHRKLSGVGGKVILKLAARKQDRRYRLD